MREMYNARPTLDCTPIVQVPLNANCRDEIIPILKALQHLYGNRALLQEILDLVGQDVNGSTSSTKGRMGMNYWQIIVLASVRLGCNLNYDKLQDLAEQHRTLRQIMGIGNWDDHVRFDWRHIQDNICLLRPETIKKINEAIVAAGHQLVPKAIAKVRGDTFVAETNVHHPTESSLLRDGLRKIMTIAFVLAGRLGLGGWRQKAYLLRQVGVLVMAVGKAARSKAKNKAERLQAAYRPLLALAAKLLRRARDLERKAAKSTDLEVMALHQELKQYLDLTEKVLDTAQRRIINGETVPNADKIFSIFEPHTELINRGKTPVPIQFGHSVLVIEDDAGFICAYDVLPNGTQDRDALIGVMKQLQDQHDGNIREASFDRGFYSEENQNELAKIVRTPCLPMSGKKGEKQHRRAGVKFRKARKRHAGVESAIGALQSGNGLKRCRDHTKPGYDRYVALGILGRNLQVLGKLLLAQESPGSAAARTKRGQAA